MKILAVDTSLGACSVAVLDGERVLARRFEPMERGHAERLAPMVEEAMRDTALSFRELDRLGVTTGPGTFTGQRIGLAFMRGLRVALKLPLVGVTSLAVMARQAMAESGIALGAAAHDARRDEVYFALEGLSEKAAQPVILSVADAARAVASQAEQSPIVIAGTAAPRISELCRALGDKIVVSPVRAPDALWVARLAAQAEASDRPPSPLYLREPDAKLPGPIK